MKNEFIGQNKLQVLILYLVCILFGFLSLNYLFKLDFYSFSFPALLSIISFLYALDLSKKRRLIIKNQSIVLFNNDHLHTSCPWNKVGRIKYSAELYLFDYDHTRITFYDHQNKIIFYISNLFFTTSQLTQIFDILKKICPPNVKIEYYSFFTGQKQ